MKIVKGNPPNIEQILAHGLRPDKGTIFTYGSTIYNPEGSFIPPHIEEHERVHMQQQGQNPQAWWDHYVLDPHFRLEQEAEAYRVQYKFYCELIRDRNHRAAFLMRLADDLTGPMYGNIVSVREALQLIKGHK